MTPFAPLDLPADVTEHGGHGHGFLEPLLGLGIFALVLVALVAIYLVLRNRGLLPAFALPTFGRPSRPEDRAKEILAERFAHGDLSTEEFLERASALNWTPGVEVVRPRSLGRS
jgi:putative membrane protein